MSGRGTGVELTARGIFWWQSRLYFDQQRASEAVQAIQNMAELWPDNGNELYLAAAECAACLSFPFSGDVAAAEQERIAQLALITLQRAIDAGYRDIDGLQKDKRWSDQMRQRPEFEQQIQRIATPEKK